MKNLQSFTWAFIAVILLATACTKDTDEVTTPLPVADQIPANYFKVGETYLLGASAKAVIYSDVQKIEAAYTRLFVAIYDSVTNTRLSDGHLHMRPIMDMGMMVHSAPYNNPTESKPADKFWNSTAVFIMSGTWQLELSFHNHLNNQEGEGKINLEVAAPSIPKVKSFKDANNQQVFFALVQPVAPKIGLNDFTVAVYYKQTMMEFLADTNYQISVTPEMPDMVHGSPNNVHPTHHKNGEYTGKVNFTMSGYWKVNLKLEKDNKLVNDSAFFDIIF